MSEKQITVSRATFSITNANANVLTRDWDKYLKSLPLEQRLRYGNLTYAPLPTQERVSKFGALALAVDEIAAELRRPVYTALAKERALIVAPGAPRIRRSKKDLLKSMPNERNFAMKHKIIDILEQIPVGPIPGFSDDTLPLISSETVDNQRYYLLPTAAELALFPEIEAFFTQGSTNTRLDVFKQTLQAVAQQEI